MKKFEVKIYGNLIGTVIAVSAQSALVKGAFAYANGNTSGVSVNEVKA